MCDEAWPTDVYASRQWHKPQNTIQHNLVGNFFCLASGALFTVWLSAYFGRLPILVFFVSFALATSVWCAAATSFESYMAARIFNGFFSVVAEAVSCLLGRALTTLRHKSEIRGLADKSQNPQK